MRRDEAVSLFGTQKNLASALGIAQNTVSSWPHDRIPLARALQIEKITKGKLRVDMDKYRRDGRA